MVHPPELGHRHVGLVDHHQEVRGKVIQEGPGGFAGSTAVEVPGVVLDPRAPPELPEHLQVVAGALLKALGLEELPPVPELPEPLLEFLLDGLDGPPEPLFGGHVVARRGDHGPLPVGDVVPRQGIDHGDPLHLVPEELDPEGLLPGGGDELQDVPPETEGGPLEGDLVAAVLHEDKLPQDLVQVVLPAYLQDQGHPGVGLRRAQAVDAGDAGHDDHVPPLEKRRGGRVAQAVDLLVDGGVLLDVGIGFGDVGLGLVVVVVGDEVVDGVVGEELLEFVVELGGEGFIVGDHKRGLLHVLYHVSNRERLSGSRGPEEGLVPEAPEHAFGELRDGPGLVAPGLEVRHQLEPLRRPYFRHTQRIIAQLNAAGPGPSRWRPSPP